jgi:hypothetical protein
MFSSSKRATQGLCHLSSGIDGFHVICLLFERQQEVETTKSTRRCSKIYKVKDWLTGSGVMVAMTVLYEIIIRYIRLLAHLINDDLASGFD